MARPVTAQARAATRSVEALSGRLDGKHVPAQPSWLCQDCPNGVAWPCSPARTRLAEAYGQDRSGLARYVGNLLFAAAADLLTTPRAELHERFVSWTG
ncbi:hypothetical protein AB0C02_28260 [Micromonospora sp. NPDC048999]|uniref:hypothetical protein n=1 Tax=Micromonospora sp. NPDC048999 TaxID=3155391 RepID=UPI0033CA0AEB